MTDVDNSIPSGTDRKKYLKSSGRATDLHGARLSAKATVRIKEKDMQLISVIRDHADDEISVNEAIRFALEETAFKMESDTESLDKPRDPIAALAMNCDCNCDCNSE
ncbi:hypothetical protein G9463_18400 [Haloarcula sp. JP-Z28]|uniref:hypothetical protein n=1 Tax=Haloarcula sp. JP-Z28 TaxID=2716715 RepID=UPI0014053B5F|nr:hypothetical protein [Haloarcula sp. JP-Z28]NHN65256.1 hypothetical protein [Haloarcula sp. JP-Z28]